jgi:hypothetical protein
MILCYYYLPTPLTLISLNPLYSRIESYFSAKYSPDSECLECELLRTAMSVPVNICVYECKRGKANPLQAWTGPEGSRGLRLPDLTTVGT